MWNTGILNSNVFTVCVISSSLIHAYTKDRMFCCRSNAKRDSATFESVLCIVTMFQLISDAR